MMAVGFFQTAVSASQTPRCRPTPWVIWMGMAMRTCLAGGMKPDMPSGGTAAMGLSRRNAVGDAHFRWLAQGLKDHAVAFGQAN